ncbi:hypothetical protein Q75_02000 [Bacillus coahuilensis p1.1.43]|uniref:Uncharacterized protein n=1 Tax=Bacillus coahuilensis p1.1.43 TaxID=1150625 RepID=A0A147KBN0_9BACI|nr:hypothetical protein [Bacillus coahuilensis]KUP08828.1 hypothetical protein Q75_02000 [Bacillus coahuilensis p1.1.43]
MKVKVDVPDLKFPIRVYVPNFMLRLLSSKFLRKQAFKHVDQDTANILLQLDHKTIQQIISTLNEFKGTELVSVETNDGTTIKVTL